MIIVHNAYKYMKKPIKFTENNETYGEYRGRFQEFF